VSVFFWSGDCLCRSAARHVFVQYVATRAEHVRELEIETVKLLDFDDLGDRGGQDGPA